MKFCRRRAVRATGSEKASWRRWQLKMTSGRKGGHSRERKSLYKASRHSIDQLHVETEVCCIMLGIIISGYLSVVDGVSERGH